MSSHLFFFKVFYSHLKDQVPNFQIFFIPAAKPGNLGDHFKSFHSATYCLKGPL